MVASFPIVQTWVQIHPIPRFPIPIFISLNQTPPFRPLHPSRVHVRSDCLSRPTLALRDSDDWWAVATAALSQALRLSLVSSPATSTPPGTPTPSLPFPSCCAKLSTETLT